MKKKQASKTAIQTEKTASAYSKLDQERIVKAGQSANLLDQDLRELVKSENELLADVAVSFQSSTVEPCGLESN